MLTPQTEITRSQLAKLEEIYEEEFTILKLNHEAEKNNKLAKTVTFDLTTLVDQISKEQLA